MSSALRQRIIDWATRFAFSEVALLLEEGCGTPLLSEDSIWRLVQEQAHQQDAAQEQAHQQDAAQEQAHQQDAAQEQAHQQDAAQEQAITAVWEQSEEDLPSPLGHAATEIYEAATEEFVVLTDAIGVASQKPTRQKAGQPPAKTDAKRHDTDVFVLPRREGGEQFLCEGISQRWSCVSAVSAFLRPEWSGAQLSVVAISEGAKTMRADLAALFGDGVRVILDWYHLAKRVRENLSRVASSMTQREEWERAMLGLLWQGTVGGATEFLAALSARREKAKADLLGYLQKHEPEIIDYGRRQQAGKPIGSGRMEKAIGSGRMEKAVAQVIGLRQKNRGMSWTKAGRRALALLTVAKLNARCAAQA